MKLFTKSSIGFAIVAIMIMQSYHVQAQYKFNFGISVPSYFGTGRFGSYLKMANEVQEHTGKDALSFGPSAGIGLFGELMYDTWGFEIYWQKYANKTNFGKNNVDAYTPSAQGSDGSQYKMSHSIFGVGASRKAFGIKGYDVWVFSALSAGSRKHTWRPKGGDFSNERTTTNRLFIGSSEAPMYFNIGLSPKFTFAEKFVLSPKIGYEMELLKGDGDQFHGGLPELVQASYATNKSQADLQAIMSGYGDAQKAHLNRFFVELRVGMKLGKN